ncbi:MAG: hypothetical protein QOJ85_4280, partial [Solirubrobacteraceae bacterium]|nr:hypothetical protein [Solirubrobacteraceae bacterium]
MPSSPLERLRLILLLGALASVVAAATLAITAPAGLPLVRVAGIAANAALAVYW